MGKDWVHHGDTGCLLLHFLYLWELVARIASPKHRKHHRQQQVKKPRQLLQISMLMVIANSSCHLFLKNIWPCSAVRKPKPRWAIRCQVIYGWLSRAALLTPWGPIPMRPRSVTAAG